MGIEILDPCFSLPEIDRRIRPASLKQGRPFRFLSQFDLCFEVVGSHTLNFQFRADSGAS